MLDPNVLISLYGRLGVLRFAIRSRAGSKMVLYGVYVNRLFLSKSVGLFEWRSGIRAGSASEATDLIECLC